MRTAPMITKTGASGLDAVLKIQMMIPAASIARPLPMRLGCVAARSTLFMDLTISRWHIRVGLTGAAVDSDTGNYPE